MMMFYISIGLLLVLASLFVILPLWSGRYQKDEEVNRVAVNAVLFKDHLSELDASLQQGRIDQHSYDLLKLELQRNLLEDNQQSNVFSLSSSKFTSISFWVIALIIFPLASVAVYWHFGGLQAWQIQEQLDQRLELFERAKTSEIDLRPEFIANEKRLQKDLQGYLGRHSDDLRSYRLLGQISKGLGDLPVAEKSYRHILNQLETGSEEITTELAQVLWDGRAEKTQQSQEANLKEVKSLLDTALEINPKYYAALRLRGVVSLAEKKPQETLNDWRKALINLPPNSQAAMQLFESITALEAALDKAGSPVSAHSQSNKTAEQGDKTQTANTLTVRVNLADTIEAEADQTVFIYARAWQGPKMPLAIARVKASELPVTLTLSDEMAMGAGLKLSQFDNVELVARLSVNGQPQATTGDWQTTKGPIDTTQSSSAYELTIDTPVE